MARSKLILASVAFAGSLVAAQGPCDPTKSSCPPLPGLTQGFKSDFTGATSIPSDWTVADGASSILSLGQNGLEFRINKGTDAPYIWTKDYIHYGKFQVTLQSSPGIGVISSAVLMSDTLDEIDWEWSGNDFNYKVPTVQTNYFGKGITGNWDRGTQPAVANNMTQNFMTYTINWTPDSITWMIDGKTIRTVYAKDGDNGQYQYPQTPARFHLGVWDAGNEGSPWYTVLWAGGNTDLTKFPYSMFVKRVEVTPYRSCQQYNYTDTSGSSASVACLNATSSTSSTTSNGSQPSGTPVSPADDSSTGSSGGSATCSSPPESTQPGTSAGCANYYNVKTGDTCESIAKALNIDVDDLLDWNPQADDNCWNLWANYAICVSTPGECDDTRMPGIPSTADTSTTTDTSSTADGSSSEDAASTGDASSLTTATIRYTSTITDMQCATTITSCPAASQTVPVVTATIAEYTTICPVSLVDSIWSAADGFDLHVGANPLPGHDYTPPYASPTDVPDEDVGNEDQDDTDDAVETSSPTTPGATAPPEDGDGGDDADDSSSSTAPEQIAAPGDIASGGDEETSSASAVPAQTSVTEVNRTEGDDDSEGDNEEPTSSTPPEEIGSATPKDADDGDDGDDGEEPPTSESPTETPTMGDDSTDDDEEEASCSTAPAEETPAPANEEDEDNGDDGQDSTSSTPPQETPIPADEVNEEDEDDLPADETDASTSVPHTRMSESTTSSTSIQGSTSISKTLQPSLGNSTTTTPTATSSIASSCLPAAASIVCPNCDGQAYSAGNGTSFQITCNVDYFGGDLKYIDCGYDKNPSDACARECANTTGCKGFSVVGFHCYLKKTLNSPKTYSGCVGGRLVDGPVCSETAVDKVETTSSDPSSGTLSSTSPAKIGPAIVPTAGCFTYVDCYNEVPGRALKAKSFDNKNLTNEACADYCQGYKYFATEYSTECYCGNSLVAGCSKVKDGRCSMPCAADRSQICGGSNGLSVYENRTCSSASGYGLSSLSSSLAVSSEPTSSSSVSMSSASSFSPSTSSSASSLATSAAPILPPDYDSANADTFKEDNNAGEVDASEGDNNSEEDDGTSEDDDDYHSGEDSTSGEEKRDEGRASQYSPRGRTGGMFSRWFA